MGAKFYTIGELARLSGQSVRRIRYYSDKGLLPSDRSAGNYRIYSETDAARLDLIRALREAGVGLAAIGKLIGRRLSLAEVLQARLAILETEIAARRRMAAVLRATLRLPNPADADLRRFWTMANRSNKDMHALVERFVERIAEGAAMDEDWRHRMIETSVPDLPDDPTPDQIAAWTELADMLEDEDFARELKTEMAAFWTGAFDPAAYRDAALRTYEAAQAAIAKGISPQAAEAQVIAAPWLDDSARAMGREPDRTFLDWQFAQYEKQSSRMGRYRQLLAILRGEDDSVEPDRIWTWLNDALRALPVPLK
ncbi:DNA-binding transcriptional MerR regulator [Shinella sp. BE166]|uniref:MerR family transcriptional regulator n=1 Tax=Shinella sp. BE166 TaxID=3373918 RepID=UPI003EBC98CF